MSVQSASSVPLTLSPINADSYCTRMQKCLCDQRVIQSVKIAFWSLGGIGASLIPVPFVNGLVAGSMLFMGGHETIQHPDSSCMRSDNKSITQTRTWKHLAAGATIAGIGWGFGTLALSSNIPIVMSLGLGWGVFGGTALGFKLAYSDLLFTAAPNQSQPVIEYQLQPAIG